VFFLIACDAPASRAPADAITFDSAKRTQADSMTLFESLNIGSLELKN
jgi:hypothetical protein